MSEGTRDPLYGVVQKVDCPAEVDDYDDLAWDKMDAEDAVVNDEAHYYFTLVDFEHYLNVYGLEKLLKDMSAEGALKLLNDAVDIRYEIEAWKADQ